MSGRKDSLRQICGKKGCNAKTKSEDKKIECENCRSVFHLSCSGFDENAFDALNTCSGFKDIIWCCITCRPKVRKTMGILEKIDEQIKQVDKKVDNVKTVLENRIEKLEKQFKNKDFTVESQIKDLTQNLNNKVEEKIENAQNNFQKNITSTQENLQKVQKLEEIIIQREEVRDREMRKKNLILYNVPESVAEDAAGRITDDCQKIKTIFARNKFTLTHENVVNIFRMGKKQENESNEESQKEDDNEQKKQKRQPNKSRCRPLLLKFNSYEYKQNVLSHCSNDMKYLDVETRASTPIHYSMDLTEQQREERRELVAEMRRRKTNGEENLEIRSGKIVTIIKRFRKEAQTRPCWANLFE